MGEYTFHLRMRVKRPPGTTGRLDERSLRTNAGWMPVLRLGRVEAGMDRGRKPRVVHRVRHLE
jgi:hypothetical protein